MSDSKISALTTQTTIHDADLVPIVDTTDTSQSLSGTTKKSTLTTLKAFLKTYFDTLYLGLHAKADTAGTADTASTATTATTAGNLSGTPALPNGTTATTQTSSDNSTKLATTAYVDAKPTGVRYAADGGSTDDYAITVSPSPSSYSNGDTYLFRANTLNTGTASLNVNSLGATTVVKKGNTVLANSDILAGNMVLVAYNSVPSITIDTYNESNQDAFQGVATGSDCIGAGQSFAVGILGTKLTSCKFYLLKTGTPTGNGVAKLYAMGGSFGTTSVPTGSALATSDNVDVSTITGSYTLITFTFSGANQYLMTAGANYVITFEYTGGSVSNYIRFGTDTSASTHPGNFSQNTGTWGALSRDGIFYVIGTTNRFEMLSQIAN